MIRNTIVVNSLNKVSGGYVPTLYVNITTAQFLYEGGTEEYTVEVADPTQIWVLDKEYDWVTLVGTGVGTDVYAAIVCEENPYVADRTQTVRITSQYCANAEITVTQYARPA